MPCPCCTSVHLTSMLHVCLFYVCPCITSMLYFHAAFQLCMSTRSMRRVHDHCPCYMSMLHFHAAWPCCMALCISMLDSNLGSNLASPQPTADFFRSLGCYTSTLKKRNKKAFPGCISVLHFDAVCPFWKSSLHVQAKCPCCMPVPHVHPACPCSMAMLRIHSCPWYITTLLYMSMYCMSLLLVHACTCLMSMLKVHAACPQTPQGMPMSMLHVYIAWPCFMSMLHAPTACPCCILCCMFLLQDPAAYSSCMSPLHVHAVCPCCMSILHSLLHVHAACPCCKFLLHVHAKYPCDMSLLHGLAACPWMSMPSCPCCMSLLLSVSCIARLLVKAACPFWMSMLHVHFHVHAVCPCCMSRPCCMSFPCCSPCSGCMLMSMLHVHAACPCCMSLKWKQKLVEVMASGSFRESDCSKVSGS